MRERFKAVSFEEFACAIADGKGERGEKERDTAVSLLCDVENYSFYTDPSVVAIALFPLR